MPRENRKVYGLTVIGRCERAARRGTQLSDDLRTLFVYPSDEKVRTRPGHAKTGRVYVFFVHRFALSFAGDDSDPNCCFIRLRKSSDAGENIWYFFQASRSRFTIGG